MTTGPKSNIADVLKAVLPTVVLIEPKKIKKEAEGGSGFIVDKNGLILTNRHNVLDKTQRYFAITYDNKKHPLKILSRNDQNDVAILKITDKGLPAGRQGVFSEIKLADSSKLQLGEEVFAIGNALGFKDTVSQGIISGLARTVESIKNLIQTDAAINPGNSGGPLIDAAGEVIGINSVMIAEAENIGFAIPINEAKKDLEDIKKFGRVRHPFLGFSYVDHKKGALVIGVKDFCKSDLKENDIILECGRQKITEDFQFEDCLKSLEVGQVAKLKILRKKEMLEVEMSVHDIY